MATRTRTWLSLSASFEVRTCRYWRKHEVVGLGSMSSRELASRHTHICPLLPAALAAPPFSMVEFDAPAASLWAWVRDFQLPTADPSVSGTDSLWVNFFKDRTQASMELVAARRKAIGEGLSLLFSCRQTKRTATRAKVDLTRTGRLMSTRCCTMRSRCFQPRYFWSTYHWTSHLDNQSPPICTPTTSFPEFSLQSGVGNTTLMGEQASGEAPHQRTFCYTSVASQDDDRKPWGGASSKLGAVASLYACAGGPEWYGSMGLRNAGVCSV